MPFTTGLADELEKPIVTAFGALEILLPDYELRLVDGAATLPMGGHMFVGRDPTYGTLGACEPLTDGTGNEAPAIKVELLVPSNSAMAALADPAAQGSPATFWMGCVDTVTGLPIPDPDLVFTGEVDFATVEIRQNGRSLTYEIISVFDKFFDDDEGVRLNGPFHRSIWEGEEGLDFNTSVTIQMPWGQDGPRPVLVKDISPFDPYYVLQNVFRRTGFG